MMDIKILGSINQMMNIIDLIAINIDTLRIDNGCFLE